jgi:uncharacterized membrane protein
VKIVKRQQIALAFALGYLWVVMIHLGALIFETFIIYPNIFHDVPQSLETTMTFLAVTGPNDFFAPVGFLSLFVGVGAIIVGWKVKPARYWLLGSVILLIIGQFLLSVWFFWPRNAIMFTEGLDVHSAVYLQETAQEFQRWHWLRFGSTLIVSVMSFIGFLNLYRHRIMHQEKQ